MTPDADSYVITLAAFGEQLDAGLVHAGAEAAKADRIEWLAANQAADLFTASYSPDLYAVIKEKIGDAPVDMLIQPAATRRKKLLVADMESTIIEQEMLDELAEMVGLRGKMALITRRAMNGELDFAESLRERVALLKGQPATILDHVAERITLMPGAEALLATMKRAGAKSWLVSGGFSCFAEPVAARLGFDRCFSNRLIVEQGVITGAVATPILGKDTKQTLLAQACAEYGLSLRDAMAVGDGANDVPMLESCSQGGGLGVAFQSKPAVRAVILHQVNYGDLSALLYAQGYGAAEITSSSRT